MTLNNASDKPRLRSKFASLVNRGLRVGGFELRRSAAEQLVTQDDNVFNKELAMGADGEPLQITAHFRGHAFHCFLDNCIGMRLLTGEGWDPQLAWILRNYANEPGLVVEVGANIGASLIPIAGDFPELAFHCFEPVPRFYRLLEKNKASYASGNVTLYDCPAGPGDGSTITVQINGANAGAIAGFDGYPAHGEVAKQSQSLDQHFANHGQGLRFLKIDVDGFENDVLTGAAAILQQQQPPTFIELHDEVQRARGSSVGELLQFFQTAGYQKALVWSNFGDYLGVADDLASLQKMAESAEFYIDALILPKHVPVIEPDTGADR